MLVAVHSELPYISTKCDCLLSGTNLFNLEVPVFYESLCLKDSISDFSCAIGYTGWLY